MSYLAAFICGVSLFPVHRHFPFSSLFISLVIGSLLVYKKRSLFPVLFLLAIAAAGYSYARLSSAPPLPDVAGRAIEFCGRPKSLAVPLGQNAGIFSQLVGIEESGNELRGMKELRVTGPAALDMRKAYRIRANIPGDAFPMNPGSYRNVLSGYAVEAREIGTASGKFSLTEAFRNARARLNDGIRENFSPGAAPFLMAVITGERGLLTKELNNAFNVTGLAHILSISGSHFGLLFLVLFSMFRLLARMLPSRLFSMLSLCITPSQAAAVLSMPFMAGYLGISDMSPPAVRSFIMIMLFLFGLLVQRKGFWLNTLLFAAAVILALQPDALLNLSFQLSFIAVLCIGMAVGEKHRAENPKNGMTEGNGPNADISALQRFGSATREYLRSSLLISLAATAGTAPLVAYYFHYFSLLSPAANLIITPVIGLVILPAAFFSSVAFLVSGAFPLHGLIDSVTAATLSSVTYAAQWSFADVKIPAFPPALLVTFYSGLLLLVLLKNRNKFLPFVIALLPILIYAAVKLGESRGLQITYLDTGQGDAAVAELPDRRTLVIDTGRNGFAAGEFLRYRGIRRIDAVVLSHGQSDHAGGIRYLLDTFIVDELWDNGRLSYAEGLPGTARHRGFRRGDTIEGSGYGITILHPYEGFYAEGLKDAYENNDSLVLQIRGKRNAFLFAGDIERDAEENISGLGHHLRSAVLKVPHHGSRSAADDAFFRSVSPEIAVISLGRNSPYGHPHPEMLEALRGAKVFRTDRDGAVTISELPDGTLKIRTMRESRLSEAGNIKEEVVNFKKLFLVW